MGISRNGVFFLWLTVLLLMVNQLTFESLSGKELEFGYKIIIYISYACFGLLATLFWQNWAIGLQSQVALDILHKEAVYQPKDSGNSLNLRFRLFLTTMTMTLIPLLFLFVLVTTEPTVQDFVSALRSDELSSVFIFDLVPIVKFFIAIFFILFFAFTGFFAGRSLEKCFTSPLNSLLNKMKKVRRGDFSVRTSVVYNDEIGGLKADFNAMVSGLDEAKGLQDAMDKYLSKEISRTVMDDANLGGLDLDATVLFSDIRGFTSLSEKLSPKEVIDFLNDYFSHVVTAITKEGGVINKYIGDCVMALFGVTTQTPMHADQALSAALAMREKVRTYNILRERAGELPVRIGIGIHSGPLVAGNMGTPDRLEYTVIGDTVNVASRIESQTKELQTDILISKELKDRLSGKQQVKFVRCPGIMVKGKSEPLELYKVLPVGSQEDKETETALTNQKNDLTAQSEELPSIPEFD
jgi:class 3 adenylate cyclase